jgi:hypothetical protein
LQRRERETQFSVQPVAKFERLIAVRPVEILVFESTVKASNFGPHGNFGRFLASSVASVDKSCTKK